MTHKELIALESDHPNLVAAILACAKVGIGRIELEIDKTELDLIARALQEETVNRTPTYWRIAELYELDITYRELDINLYAKVAIRLSTPTSHP